MSVQINWVIMNLVVVAAVAAVVDVAAAASALA